MVLTMPRLRNWKGEEVHGHERCAGKAGDLPARFAQDPFADRLDDADLFRDRDEQRRFDLAAVRPLPTDERLESFRDAGRQRDDRLELDDEFPARERAAQVDFDLAALLQASLHARIEAPVDATPTGLCFVKGDVGILDQGLHVAAVPRRHGDADARADIGVVGADPIGSAQRANDPRREVARLIVLADAELDHGELVAAEPRHDVACADAFLQPPAGEAQEPVPGRMPERVVDLLEPVEIEVMDRERARQGNVAQGVLDAPRQMGAIGQARQSVVMGHEGDLRLGMHARRCVEDRAFEDDGSPVLAAHAPGGLRNPDLLARPVPIDLRDEIRHPSLRPHLVQEFVAAFRIDIPFARDVVHGGEHLGLVGIAVELHESRIGPQLPPVQSGSVDADDGVLEKAAIFHLGPFEGVLLRATIGDVREGAHGAAIREHGGANLQNGAVRSPALVNRRRFEDAARADPGGDVLAHAAEFADRPLIFDNLLKMQGIRQDLLGDLQKIDEFLIVQPDVVLRIDHQYALLHVVERDVEHVFLPMRVRLPGRRCAHARVAARISGRARPRLPTLAPRRERRGSALSRCDASHPWSCPAAFA